MEKKIILHKSRSKRSFNNKIYSFQKQADARDSADITCFIMCRSC